MDVLAEVLRWSEHRPAWQRDCLRRLVVTGRLSDQDVSELVELCKATNGAGAAGKTPPVAVPLGPEHVAPIQGATEPVLLTGIQVAGDVGALAAGSTLQFAPNGLTVVYGDNGAGKSSYARVLRRVCRARAPLAHVRPNVFQSKPGARAAAGIEYMIGAHKKRLDWVDGSVLPSELAAVTVFDADCAGVYVDAENDVAYLPLGLDLFTHLASACDRVRMELEREDRVLLAASLYFPALLGDTEVGRLIAGLSPNTAETEIVRLGRLSEPERARLAAVRSAVARLAAEDPAQRARGLRLGADRVASLTRSLVKLTAALDDAAIVQLRQLTELRAAAAEAARAAAAASFDSEPIPSVGVEAWRILWEGARAYSEQHAYPGEPFPVARDGAVCVLCQQELAPTARDRLVRFETFVRQEAQRKLEATEAALLSARESLRSLVLESPDQANTVAELRETSEQLAGAVSTFCEGLVKRRDEVLRGAEAGAWESATPLPPSPVNELAAICRDRRAQAAEVDKTAAPVERAALQRELAELDARERLSLVRSDVVAEVERRKLRAAYARCVADTNTHAITRRNTELTEEAVSASLRNKFSDELRNLGLKELTVSLEPTGGAKGVLYHHLQFKGMAVGGTKVGDVLSEGEHRSAALAALLAELAVQPSKSTLVVDDPVSSLDHLRREGVARRLVDEARSRPVVVFTHELVFLLLLQRACEESGVPICERHLRREPTGPGIPVSDLPWYGMPVGKRIGILKQEWQGAEKTSRTGPQAAYEAMANRIYGLLRETWERAVEEVLLNGAVQRLGLEIQTKRLSVISDITDDDVKAIDTGMTKASQWMSGHDAPAASNAPVPGPDELIADINALDTWVGEVRRRRK